MQDPIPSIHLSEDEDTIISQDDIHTSYEPSLGGTIFPLTVI